MRVSSRQLFAALVVLPLTVFAQTASKSTTTPSTTDAEPAYRDIQATLGMVPTFFKLYPPEAIAGAWSEYKSVELAQTSVPNKYKELIGLAVAAQIPCTYCVYAHTTFAKLNGASEREIREAVAIASSTRFWSTYLNGQNLDEGTFEREVSQMYKKYEAGMGGSGSAEKTQQTQSTTVPTPTEALKEIKQTFGFVPTFMKNMPQSAIPGAWQDMKTLDMNPNGAIPDKYKSLISLAVGAQIPCKYCVTMDTQSARMMKASTGEMQEALLMAALTRKWSTVLNGNQQDFNAFKSEMDQLAKNAKMKMGTGGSPQDQGATGTEKRH